MLHCSFRNSPIHFGEEIEFSSRRNEFSMTSPQGLTSILGIFLWWIFQNFDQKKRKANFFTTMFISISFVAFIELYDIIVLVFCNNKIIYVSKIMQVLSFIINTLTRLLINYLTKNREENIWFSNKFVREID